MIFMQGSVEQGNGEPQGERRPLCRPDEEFETHRMKPNTPNILFPFLVQK